MTPDSNGDIVVTDARGRKLTVHAMDPGDQLDFFEACGANSTNLAWINMALWACSVTAIDSVPVRPATNKQHVKELARRLGHDGLAAVRIALGIDESREEYGEPQPDTTGADLDVAKN